MSSSSGISVAFLLGIIASSGRSASCQELRLLEVGVQPPAADSIVPSHPSGFSLTVKSVGRAVSGSALASTAGLEVDQVYCERHHGREASFLFGPCTFYVSGGAAAGWFGGAFLGSTVGAARVAHKRGCPWHAAILRAIGGAAIGVAPGVTIVARRPGKYPPSRSMLIAAAPLLSGIGAAAAVIGCQVK